MEAIPDEDSIDRVEVRKSIQNPYDMTDRGEKYMKRVFGEEDMGRFVQTMDEYWPDLRTFSVYYMCDDLRTNEMYFLHR